MSTFAELAYSDSEPDISIKQDLNSGDDVILLRIKTGLAEASVTATGAGVVNVELWMDRFDMEVLRDTLIEALGPGGGRG